MERDMKEIVSEFELADTRFKEEHGDSAFAMYVVIESDDNGNSEEYEFYKEFEKAEHEASYTLHRLTGRERRTTNVTFGIACCWINEGGKVDYFEDENGQIYPDLLVTYDFE